MKAKVTYGFIFCVTLRILVCNAKAIPIPTAGDVDLSNIDAETIDILERFFMLIINSFKPWVNNELPCLGIPSLDPYTTPWFEINATTPIYELIAGFKNFKVSGMGSYETMKVKYDLRKLLTLDMEFYLPSISLKGDYFVKGCMWIFPAFGKGQFDVQLSNITVRLYGRMHFFPTVSLSGFDFSVQITNADFNINGLYFGINTLINNALNSLGLRLIDLYVMNKSHDALVTKLEDLANQYFHNKNLVDLTRQYYNRIKNCLPSRP